MDMTKRKLISAITGGKTNDERDLLLLTPEHGGLSKNVCNMVTIEFENSRCMTKTSQDAEYLQRKKTKLLKQLEKSKVNDDSKTKGN